MAPAAAPRLLSLDVLRGATIAAMILVNNPGSWSHVYPPLRHAEWHGCTPTDLVFPFFLFMVGVSIALALGGRVDRGDPRGAIVVKTLRRGLLLYLFGLLLAGFPSFPWERIRVLGVLPRIAICYVTCALLFLFTSPRVQVRVAAGCLLAYWPLMTLVPVPGIGAPDLSETGANLAAWLDRTLFGRHLWRGGDYDPEGLLSTVPALATTLIGVSAGRLLRSDRPRAEQVLHLLLRGCGLVVLGSVWGWFFPINKALWTSSFALYTGGLALCALGLCVWTFDVRQHPRLARPFTVYGVNALAVFVGSGLLGRTLGSLWKLEDGRSAQRWFYQEALASWLDPLHASLAYALLWVAAWYGVLEVLWRRGIVLKV